MQILGKGKIDGKLTPPIADFIQSGHFLCIILEKKPTESILHKDNDLIYQLSVVVLIVIHDE